MAKKQGDATILDIPKESVYIHPKDGSLYIDASVLKIKLSHFKMAVQSHSTKEVMLALLGAWLTVITADFNSIFGVPVEHLKEFFVILLIIVTGIILVRPFKVICASCLRLGFMKKVHKRHKEFADKYETDPERFVDNLMKKTKS